MKKPGVMCAGFGCYFSFISIIHKSRRINKDTAAQKQKMKN